MSRADTRLMTVEEWAKDARQMITDFATVWEVSRAATPERFPEKMTPGDWDEQFWLLDT